MSAPRLLGRAGGLFVEAPHLPGRLLRGLRRDTLERAVAGRVVMVTGASSGIGRASAVRLAAAGATVLLVARGRDALDEVRAEIAAAGGDAHVHPCDLSDLDAVGRLATEVLERHGRVDVLVNNAGRSIRRSIADSTDRMHDFERTMQLNYFGAVRLILALLPGMRVRGDGHIVNISTAGVQFGAPRYSAYIASKAALDAFSRCIAAEVHGDGVRITTVHMWLVRTPMIEPAGGVYDGMPGLSPEQAAELVADAIVHRPRRVATPLGNVAEVVHAVAPGAFDRLLRGGYRLLP
jgi:NAD(P)-dependent dehydrogenase (short-subunit alcohol dehydrogenase family)